MPRAKRSTEEEKTEEEEAPINLNPTQVEPTQVEPTQVEPTQVEPTQVEPTQVESIFGVQPERHKLNVKGLQKMQGGKLHPTWPIVLDHAHNRTYEDGTPAPRVRHIHTEMVQAPSDENNQTCIFKAIVTMDDGSTFMGWGDANPKNVPGGAAPHIIRMSETRSKGRALRDAVNIGEAIEEEIAPPPVVNPIHKQIEDIWSSDNINRKQKIRSYILEHTNIRPQSLADVKSLPDTFLLEALKQ